MGKGIALHLADYGAEGIVICGRHRENGKRSAREIMDTGCTCEFVQADLTIEEDCRKVVQVCDEKFGRVQGLVNAAGLTDRGAIEETTVALWPH